MTKTSSDVIVIGGGIVGATLAALLCRNGITCTVVEFRQEFEENNKNSVDPRALALSVATINILASIGIWQMLPVDKVGRFREMYVWDKNSKGKIHFNSADICQPELGYVIEQSVIQELLNSSMGRLAGVSIVRGCSIASYIVDNNQVSVQLTDGSQLTAQLLVGADGVNSKARQVVGIENMVHDYDQRAVVSMVTTTLSHGDVARQRFLDNGPLAFLPMYDPYTSAIVWSTNPEHAHELMDMTSRDFNSELQLAFDNELGEVKNSGPRLGYPLTRAQAKNYCSDRFALIGDAAHSVHPLAGQGANLGILDAASLSEVIVSARNKRRNIASRSVLRRYERWRKGENYQMMIILDGFKYVFENQAAVVRNLRGFALSSVNILPYIKHLIMLRAMGLEGDIPVIAREFVD